MLRTHIALIVLFILLFLPHISGVTGKVVFTVIALLATLMPDIDNAFSVIGKHKAFRFFQLFIKHRGFLHSLTFCIVVAGILAVFLPVTALPFFLGYSIHVFSDSFTVEGVMPFWPYRKKSMWRLKTGGRIETTIFIFIILFDIFFFIFLIKNII